MSDDQKRKDYSPGGKVMLVGAAATVLVVITMSAGGEAPVRLLQYAFLTGGLIALACGLNMMMSQKRPGRPHDRRSSSVSAGREDSPA